MFDDRVADEHVVSKDAGYNCVGDEASGFLSCHVNFPGRKKKPGTVAGSRLNRWFPGRWVAAATRQGVALSGCPWPQPNLLRGGALPVGDDLAAALYGQRAS